MESIDPEDLYEERGTVSFARPLLQGDIFAGVIVPGLSTDPITVQIVTHPCSMRRGTDLNERIQVVPVENYQRVSDWGGHLRVMPLPDLLEDGDHYAAKFVDLSATAAGELTVDKRIASLSQRGILVLQQRLVMHSTRVDMSVTVFREQSAPVLAEAEMQEIWTELVLVDDPESLAEVASVGQEFQGWLDEASGRRRDDLKSEANHAGLRRAVRDEATRRRTDRVGG